MLLKFHPVIEWNDHAEVFEGLLIGKANLDARYNDGMTLLHLAVLYNYIVIIKLLLKKKPDIIHVTTKSGLSPLHIAVRDSTINIVKLLLRKGVDVNLRTNDHGLTALNSAVFRDCEKMAELLLKNGADVNLRANHGNTALHSAACKSETMVSLLLEYEADVNLKDNDGNTALHIATRGRSIEIVSLLLDNEADVNLKNIYGYTPLHYAACLGFRAITELLLNKGAKINIKDNKCQTPLDKAINSVIALNRIVPQNRMNIAKLLISVVLSENPDKIKPEQCERNDELSNFWDETQSKTKNLVADISVDFVHCFSKHNVCCSMEKLLNDNPNNLAGLFTPKIMIQLADRLKEAQADPDYEKINRWLSQVNTRLETLSYFVNKKVKYYLTLAHKHLILCSNEGKVVALDKDSQNEVLKNLAINDIKSVLKAAKLNTAHSTTFFNPPVFLANVTHCVKSRCVIS